MMTRSAGKHARSLRGLTIFAGLIVLWWLATLTDIPAFLLPSPVAVANALWHDRAFLAWHSLITASEVLSGLVIGVLLGSLLALAMTFSPRLQRWMMPLVLTSQAIPVFALAPLLVLWFGFGIGAKVAMAVLVIFFPVTSAFYDGLRRVNQRLARSGANHGGLTLGAAAPHSPDGGPARLRFRSAYGGRGRPDRRHYRRMGWLCRRAGLRDAECQRPDADRPVLRRAVYSDPDDGSALAGGRCPAAAPDYLVA